jgi:ABC-2 type transport system permease protein
VNTWANIKTITKRELGAYFTSPLAFVFIVIFLLLCGFFTFMIGGFFERGEASLVRPFFDWHPWFYLFLVPAVGMRLWSEERRQGTIELLLTMPITSLQAILGRAVGEKLGALAWHRDPREIRTHHRAQSAGCRYTRPLRNYRA